MTREQKRKKLKDLEDQMQSAGRFFSEFFRKTLTRPLGGKKDFTLLELKGMSAFVDKEHEYTMSELSRNAHLPLSNISIIIKRLEEKGLVVRDRDTSDRRIVKVRLTNQGNKMMTTFVKNREQEMEKALGGLSDQDIRELFAALEKAADILKKINF